MFTPKKEEGYSRGWLKETWSNVMELANFCALCCVSASTIKPMIWRVGGINWSTSLTYLGTSIFGIVACCFS